MSLEFKNLQDGTCFSFSVSGKKTVLFLLSDLIKVKTKKYRKPPVLCKWCANEKGTYKKYLVSA